MAQHIGIIGGGIMGCSTAYYLTQMGHTSITLFEQTDIACHSSGKAGGFLARTWCDETDLRELARAGYDLHLELAKQFPDLDYRGVDTYKVVTDEKMDRSVTRDENWLNVNVNEINLLSTSQDTAKVSPKPLCEKLLSQAKLNGTKIVFEKVVNLTFDGGTRVHTATQSIIVDTVVITAGPWSTKFIQEYLPKYKIPAIPPQTRAHSVVLKPSAGTCVPSDCLFQYHHSSISGIADPEIYPLPDGMLYICGEVDKVDLPPTEAEIKPDLKRCENLIKQVSFAVPALGNAEVLKMQACYLPDSPDHIPLIGHIPGYDNVVVGTGHTFWGILNGPITGKCLAELLLCGKVKTVNLKPFDPKRFC